METRKYVFLDTEYNNTRERCLRPVCASIIELDGEDVVRRSFWLHDSGTELDEFKEAILSYMVGGYLFVSFNVEAEASLLLSIGVDPLKAKWIDLYLEYVMLSNHNNQLSKGEQYIDGKIKKLPMYGFEKGKKNLAAALFKLCQIMVDTDHKTAMRNLIISAPDKFSEEEKKAIMSYCDEDTEHLPKMLKEINKWFQRLIPREHKTTLKEEVHWRAECSIRTARMVRHGYPIDFKRTTNLAKNVPGIIRDCCKDINAQFPSVVPFRWNSKSLCYSMDTKAVRGWVYSQNFKGWDKTETGLISLSLESWEKYFPFKHEYPRDNFGAQMVRYFRIQQSLRSFNMKGGADNKTFFDYVGSDSMCRPYLGQYVAQSSRFQPASTGYIFLKPAFLRTLCHPPQDYLMGSIDYSSQEFLLAALLSGDNKMLEAYKEGDVYLYFAKQARMVPQNATKSSHKRERDLAKSTVLGISYSMTCVGLSRKLTSDTGSYVSEGEAQKYIDNFNTVFSTFYYWKQEQIELYKIKGYVRLADGFYMWGNNPNERSLTNMPIQGFGGVILRKAIQLAQDDSMAVVAPLHDSLYIMFRSDDRYAMDRLANAMVEAFCYYFTGRAKEDARSIRLDLEVWGDNASQEIEYSRNYSVAVEKVHVDPRGKKEYEQFKKYFDVGLCTELL